MAIKHPLYFLAVLPPPGLQAEVTGFKQYIADNWGPRHALRSPPHLTLIPPFAWPHEHFKALVDGLETFALKQSPFSIGLKNFQAFPPRVIFIDPLKNSDLDALFQHLLQFMKETFDWEDARNRRPFHPHMTIAHRDVPGALFPEIWSYFRSKQYERRFLAQAFTLLKLEQGIWREFRSFAFT